MLQEIHLDGLRPMYLNHVRAAPGDSEFLTTCALYACQETENGNKFKGSKQSFADGTTNTTFAPTLLAPVGLKRSLIYQQLL